MKKKDNVIWRVVDKEVLLLDTHTGDYYCLNATGAMIWTLLNQGLPEDDIVNKLSSVFKIDRKIARADALEFIATLEESSIVE